MKDSSRLMIPAWALGLATVMFTTLVMMAFCEDADAQRRRRRTRGPLREAITLRISPAFTGACDAGTEFCVEPEAGLQLVPDLGLGIRLGLVTIEGRFFHNPYTDEGREASATRFLASLKIHPISQGDLDPYISFGVGYMALFKDQGRGDDLLLDGLAGQIGVGVDYFLGRQFSIGLSTDYLVMTPSVENPNADPETEGFWTGRLNFTLYFGLPTASSEPRKKKRRRRRRRPKKKKKKEEFF